MQYNDFTIYLHARKFYIHITIVQFDHFILLSSLLVSPLVGCSPTGLCIILSVVSC